MNELHLFAGAGGGILAGQLLGHRCVCAVECEPYAQSVLVSRQNDGSLPTFPIWNDVRTFDGKPWRGVVDVVAGGFPCQDISVAGKGVGITGERSGMWTHMARVIGEVRPRFAFVENSPALITRGLGVVLSDLAALGYDCKWTVLGAADVGAPHQRDRLWLLASNTMRDGFGKRANEYKSWQLESEANACTYGSKESLADSNSLRELQQQRGKRNEWRRPCDDVPDADSERCEEFDVAGITEEPGWTSGYVAEIGDSSWWATERGLDRVVNGVAHRTHRLKAIGNGQVPACAAAAWKLLGGP